MPEFNLIRLTITIVLETPVSDPYGLFALKHLFPSAFRPAVGCSHPECRGCSRQDSCPYWANFAQSLSSDPEMVKRHQKPPLPFVWDIPPLPTQLGKGGTILLGLTLAGAAIEHLKSFLNAFALAFSGEFGVRFPKGRIARISIADYDGNETPFDPVSPDVYPPLILLESRLAGDIPLPSQELLGVNILTPLRILQEGRPLRKISFSAFSRALCRRVSAISACYGGGEIDADYRWLAEEGRLVATVRDETEWVDWGSGRSGLLGRLVFKGPVEQFCLFLRLGEYLHLGKGAAYGLGRFAIE
jgi:hypothetical protein